MPSKRTSVNVIISGERLNDFPLKLGIGKIYLFSQLPLNLVPDVLGRTTRQENEIKGIQIRKEELEEVGGIGGHCDNRLPGTHQEGNYVEYNELREQPEACRAHRLHLAKKRRPNGGK